MSKFYYIVKGATKGDNVGEWESTSEEQAQIELEATYGIDETSKMTIEIINKPRHTTEGKRIFEIRLAEANKIPEDKAS